MAGMLAVPAIVLGCGLLVAAGWSPFASAQAATTDNVVVTATVAAAMSVTDGCSGTAAITVAMGTIAYSGACAISYGATNDATQKLTIQDSNAAPFQGTIPNTAVDCAALPAGSDQAGVHIVGTANNSTIMAGWATTCTTASAVGANTYFRPVPASGSPADACQSATTSATNHQCSFEWAVIESGSNLAPAGYAGTAVFTVVDI